MIRFVEIEPADEGHFEIFKPAHFQINLNLQRILNRIINKAACVFFIIAMSMVSFLLPGSYGSGLTPTTDEYLYSDADAHEISGSFRHYVVNEVGNLFADFLGIGDRENDSTLPHCDYVVHQVHKSVRQQQVAPVIPATQEKIACLPAAKEPPAHFTTDEGIRTAYYSYLHRFALF